MARDSRPGDDTPIPSILASEEHDNLARISYQLLIELWIARDRIAVLERLLVDKGVIAAGEVDGFRPDPAMSERLERMRDAMVESVAGAPFSGTLSVEDLIQRGRRLAATRD